MQLDRRCGSGLQAVHRRRDAGADRRRRRGHRRRRREHEPGRVLRARRCAGAAAAATRRCYDRLARGRVTAGGAHHPVAGRHARDGGEPAPRVRASRAQEQDELALRSHQRAVAAQDAGRFDDEIVPVTVTRPQGRRRSSTATSTRAPTPRSSAWPALRPVMRRAGPRGHRDRRQRQRPERRRRRLHRHDAASRPPSSGLRPLAPARSAGPSPACTPQRMGIGPVPAPTACSSAPAWRWPTST